LFRVVIEYLHVTSALRNSFTNCTTTVGSVEKEESNDYYENHYLDPQRICVIDMHSDLSVSLSAVT